MSLENIVISLILVSKCKLRQRELFISVQTPFFSSVLKKKVCYVFISEASRARPDISAALWPLQPLPQKPTGFPKVWTGSPLASASPSASCFLPWKCLHGAQVRATWKWGISRGNFLCQFGGTHWSLVLDQTLFQMFSWGGCLMRWTFTSVDFK